MTGRHPGTESGTLASRLSRTLAIVRLIVLGLRLLLLGDRDQQRGARLLRQRIDRVGGAWIKLGQGLALRHDLLPAAYCDELAKLLDAVAPFGFEAVEATIARDFGRPLSSLFDSFDRTPIAAGSIGQVHRAAIGARSLVVKVRRPGAPQRFASDLALMSTFARLTDLLRMGRGIALTAVVAEFDALIRRELDYREEAFAARRLRINARDDPLERHITVHMRLTSERVLTMDCVDGVSLSRVIEWHRRADTQSLSRFRAAGHNEHRIAEHLVWNTLNQIYRFGLFHADPHPANLLIGRTDAINYIDYGQVGRITDVNRRLLIGFAWLLAREEVGEASRRLLEIIQPTETTDVGAALRDLESTLDRYVCASGSDAGDEAPEVRPVDIAILEIARRHLLAVSPELTLYLKTISTVDSVILAIAPGFDILALQQRFFQRLAAIEFADALCPTALLSRASTLGEAVAGVVAFARRLNEDRDEADALIRLVRRRLSQINALLLPAATVAGLLFLFWLAGRRFLLGVPIVLYMGACLVVVIVGVLVSITQAAHLGDRNASSRISHQRRRARQRRP